MVTEDYVSFETAELLKEKGFKGQGEHFYEDNKITNFANYWHRITPEQRYKAIEAPTLQMAMKWLREVHNKHIYTVPVVTDDDGVMGYWWEDGIITNRQYNSVKTGKLYNSPEEAYENAIKYCLINLI